MNLTMDVEVSTRKPRIPPNTDSTYEVTAIRFEGDQNGGEDNVVVDVRDTKSDDEFMLWFDPNRKFKTKQYGKIELATFLTALNGKPLTGSTEEKSKAAEALVNSATGRKVRVIATKRLKDGEPILRKDGTEVAEYRYIAVK